MLEAAHDRSRCAPSGRAKKSRRRHSRGNPCRRCRTRRSRARKTHARRAALALDLSSRRPRVCRHAQHRASAHRKARRAPQPRPPGHRQRTGFGRRHAQMAAAHALDGPARQGRRDRMRLHPGERPRNTLRLQPGRLHAQLFLLLHRHAELGAQPDRRRDCRPAPRRARSARRLSRRRSADGWARALRRGTARRLQRRFHGHGRAALQPRQRQRRYRRAHRRRRAIAVETAHHRLDLGRRPRDGETRRALRDVARCLAACDQRRAARQVGSAQQEVSNQRAAAGLPRIIPGFPTRGA